jgi:uncharacterized protein YjgD (DUF1641 family)
MSNRRNTARDWLEVLAARMKDKTLAEVMAAMTDEDVKRAIAALVTVLFGEDSEE